jgi:hypothetical protein
MFSETESENDDDSCDNFDETQTIQISMPNAPTRSTRRMSTRSSRQTTPTIKISMPSNNESSSTTTTTPKQSTNNNNNNNTATTTTDNNNTPQSPRQLRRSTPSRSLATDQATASLRSENNALRQQLSAIADNLSTFES